MAAIQARERNVDHCLESQWRRHLGDSLLLTIYRGQHLTYIGTGVLTAFAAGLAGSFFGFLLGIPRSVSSGDLRKDGTSPGSGGPASLGLFSARAPQTAPTATPPATPAATPAGTTEALAGSVAQETPRAAHPTNSDDAYPAGPPQPPPPPTATSEVATRFAQSTNLAEISDWLTKLLLGAGLVSLTKLGKPAGQLFRSVAAGLSTTVTSSAIVMAGAIIVTYLAIGFMATYIGTTIWYAGILERTAQHQRNQRAM